MPRNLNIDKKGRVIANNLNDPEFWNKFWSRVDKTDSCWLWQPPFNNYGYGTIRINYKPILVHRLSYELVKGEIPGAYILSAPRVSAEFLP